MSSSAREVTRATGVAFASLAAAVLLRWLLDPVLGDTLPLTTLFGAVAVTVWFGGYRPALVVAFIGYLACAYLFVEPRGQLTLAEPRNLVGALLYLLSTAVVIGFGEALRRARQRDRIGRETAGEVAERMRITLASIGDGVIATDPEGRVTSMNAVAEALTGWTTTEAAGQPLTRVFRIVNESTRQEVDNPALRALKEGVIVGLANHTILIAKDGTERPIDDSASPIRSASGEVVGSVLVFRDISDRHRVEAEQRAVQEQVATTLDSVTDGFIRYDRDWRMMYVNTEAERINHFHRSEVLGRTLWELFPALIGTSFEREFRRAMAERVKVEFENHYEPWDRWYALTCYPAPDGGLTTFIRDITEQKRTQQRLAETEARSAQERRLYETVLTNTPDFIYVFSLDHKVLYANDALIRMWGRGREGAIGKTFLEIGYEPWHAAMHDREIDQVRATRQPIRGEVPFNGTLGRRQYEYIFVPIIGADGEVEAVAGTTRDVTERRQVEDQLRSNQETFSALIKGNPFGMYVVDADFRLQQISLGAQKVFETVDPLLGEDFAGVIRTLWPEPFATEVIDRFRHTLATGEPYAAPSTIERRADIGAVEAYDWRIERIGTPDGRYGVVCYFYDLSDRQRWEATLRRSEERLRLATDAAELGIWTWQPEEDVVVWENERPYEIFALERTEPPINAARFKADFLVPEDVDSFERAYVRTMELKVPLLCECRIRRTDGTIRWVEFTGAVVQGEERLRLIGTVQDITERKRAEEALRQSEERSAFVRQSSGVGFWYCDLPFDVLQWDDLVKAHFHLPPDAAVTIETFYDRIHPDDREPTRRAIEQSIAGHTHYSTDYRTVHPETGAVRWVRAIGRTFYAVDGTPTRFDGVTLDVSEQKRAEAELLDADRKKDEFLATLAHELRNPLAPIRNGLQLIRLAGADGRIEQARAMMERQLGQMIRLVDDLLDMSRVTTGKLELRRERVELRSVIDAALETSRPVIEQAGHDLTVVLPDAPLVVDGDPVRLAQALSNLLLNSAKYTHRGGHIRVTVTREDGSAVVVVGDDGIGIPPDMLETVFEMFTRVDRTLEKTTGGLGIGLSLVRRLVQMHGGGVTARSEGEGRGCEFIVRLPAVPSAVPGDDRSAPGQPTRPRSRRRILVADDNVDSAESLGQLLDLLGYEARTAQDGLQALEVAETFRPDVVLLDIAMPRLNGHDACRRIREQPWAGNTVVVAMTGWSPEDGKLRSLDGGFDHHLVKPVDPVLLERLLATLKVENS